MQKTILSIQSHVAHGFVGGRAATFPLQTLGWDVDVVNTVNFSNHSGYRRRPGEGTRATGAQLQAIFDGLELNGILEPARLLTGYTPNADCLEAIVRLAHKLRQRNGELVFLLDPVLGDNGRLYVAEDVIPLYRQLLPLATIITPNWFEVETLVNFKLDSMDSLRNALNTLHKTRGVQHVVISSIPVSADKAVWLPARFASETGYATEGVTYASENLLCISSSYKIDIQRSTVHTAIIPQIRGYFSGVGDLFSAMILGHYEREGDAEASGQDTTSLSYAVGCAIRTTHAILRKTAKASALVPGANGDGYTDEELDAKDEARRPRRMKARELRIVGSADIILSSGESGTDDGHGIGKMELWSDFWK